MGEITGRQVFFFTSGAFGIIIAVNVYMAVQAVSTFPGLEVKNSYVASQSWDAERMAQDALGWSLAHGYEGGQLRLTFTDATGAPAVVKDLSVLVGRTTESRDDLRPAFEGAAGDYVASADLGVGKWMMLVEARAEDGTLFRQRLDLLVK